MIVFKALGYDVAQLSLIDKEAMTEILSQELIRPNQHISMVLKAKRVISKEIDYALKTKHHFIFGVYKDDKLLAVAMVSSVNNEPWIGHLVIDKAYRKKGKLIVVLMHFLLNVFFKGIPVLVGHEMVDGFEKHLLPKTKLFKHRVFNPLSALRFEKIINKG